MRSSSTKKVTIKVSESLPKINQSNGSKFNTNEDIIPAAKSPKLSNQGSMNLMMKSALNPNVESSPFIKSAPLGQNGPSKLNKHVRAFTSYNAINHIKPQTENFDQILESSKDYDMIKYRHMNKKWVELDRREKIHTFVYDKKIQNKLKYSAKSKINQTALPVPRGTISVMLNVAKKDYGFNLQNFKKKIPAKSKFKMKWKTIQWLLSNKPDVIKQLFNIQSLMLKHAKNKKDGMSREEFGDLLSSVGLGADQNLVDKLFYIFDDDNSGTVDYKELIIGLEMFKENTIDEKLQVFMQLCDADGSGAVSQEELYNVLKQNVLNHDDKIKLKQIVKQIFRESDKDGNGQLDKTEILEATSRNPLLRGLLEESVRNVKRVDQIIESDLEEPFHCWVPISANFVNYKEGIHFKLVDKLLEMLCEIETNHQKRKEQRQVFKEALLKGNPDGIKEEDFGDSFNDDNN